MSWDLCFPIRRACRFQWRPNCFTALEEGRIYMMFSLCVSRKCFPAESKIEYLRFCGKLRQDLRFVLIGIWMVKEFRKFYGTRMFTQRSQEPLDTILSWTNPFSTLTPRCFKILFHIIFPSVPESAKWSPSFTFLY